jgi:hypothetical protein
MSLYTFLFPIPAAVDELRRHNLAMEDQARRALLTPAERQAEDKRRAAEAEEVARDAAKLHAYLNPWEKL